MLRMRMELSQATELLCVQALQLFGGATESIFPKAEALLLASPEHEAAILHLGARKNMDKYRSLMDFLFCEIFTWYRSYCFKFYLSGRFPLRSFLNVEQVLFFDDAMVRAIELAYDAARDARISSWKAYQEVVIEETKPRSA